MRTLPSFPRVSKSAFAIGLGVGLIMSTATCSLVLGLSDFTDQCDATTPGCKASGSGGSGGHAGSGGGGHGGAGGSAGALQVMPGDTKLGILRPLAFTASVPVAWSVQEGASGGTIDDKGNYRSPATPGVYHIVATDKADSGRKQPVQITVVPLGITLAGGIIGGEGNIDGTPSHAHLLAPEGAAGYTGPGNGVLVVADTGNNTLRKYDEKLGKVTTLAGTAGMTGTTDGIGPAAQFNSPTDAVVNATGSKTWVVDRENSCVRSVDIMTGNVITFAGQCGTPGHVDGATGAATLFGKIKSMILGPAKDALYVCDFEIQGASSRTIRRIDAVAGKTTSIITGVVDCRMAADNYAGLIYYQDNGKILAFSDALGGPPVNPAVTTLVSPTPEVYTAGIAVYIGYGNGNDLYSLSQSGPVVYHYQLGTGAFDSAPFSGAVGVVGNVDGPIADARYDSISAISGYSPGSLLFVTDRMTSAVQKIDIGGNVVTTALGVPRNVAKIDGVHGTGRLTSPLGIAADAAGNMYVADVLTDVGPDAKFSSIRKIDANETVSTLAGVKHAPGATGVVDGPGDQATFGLPWDVVLVNGVLYVSDPFAQAIRTVDVATGVVKTFAGELGVSGSNDGVGVAAHFNGCAGLATDGTNLYVADSANYAIRKIVIATGEVTTLAGGTMGTANGTGKTAQFLGPFGVAYVNGIVYVADALDYVIRSIDVATGAVTTLIGISGEKGQQDGDASKATLSGPYHLGADGIGSLYVSEGPNALGGGISTIRRIDIATRTVSAFAGTAGQIGVAPGPLPATVNCPGAFAFTPTGDMLFTDTCDGAVLLIAAL